MSNNRHLAPTGIRLDTELDAIDQMLGLLGKTPHAGQRAFLRHKSRFKVLFCGRRWGKTQLLAIEIFLHIQEMHATGHPSPRVRLIAPENKQIQETLNYLRELCHGYGLPFDEHTNPRNWYIQAGAVRIEPRSARNRETHRGAGITYAVIDECSEIPGDLFFYAILPSLTDYQGHVLMAGTPKGKNWIVEWASSMGVRVPRTVSDYRQLLISPDEQFLLMRAPTWDNPYLPPAELTRLRSKFQSLRHASESELSSVDLAFLQEYGAYILTGFEKPFPVEPIYVDEWSQDDLQQFRYADWVLGLDYGFVAPSACVVGALCPDGNYRVVHTAYEVRVDESQYVSWVRDQLVHRIGSRPVQMVIADPSFWDQVRGAEETTLAGKLHALQLRLEKGIKERELRWNLIRDRLAEQRVLIHRAKNTALLEELEKAVPADMTGHRRDIKKPDHALTALSNVLHYEFYADIPKIPIPESETPMEEEIRDYLQSIYEGKPRQVRRRPAERILSKPRW